MDLRGVRAGAILLAAALSAGAEAAEAASVEIRDAVARVTVIPEARADVVVEILRPNPRLPLQVRQLGGRTIVDGDLNWNVRGCRTQDGRPIVHVRGVGDVAWADMPRVTIRTPRDIRLAAGGAVFGVVGRAQSVDLVNAGCGDWTIANVAGRVAVSQAGSGDTRMGSAGSAKLRSAGSGDMSAGVIREGAEIDIAGSGDVQLRSASGPLKVRVAGSGDVTADAGQVSEMTVRVAGSGDVTFGGTAQTLKAGVAGSGDIHVHAVRGAVDRHVAGSGRIRID